MIIDSQSLPENIHSTGGSEKINMQTNCIVILGLELQNWSLSIPHFLNLKFLQIKTPFQKIWKDFKFFTGNEFNIFIWKLFKIFYEELTPSLGGKHSFMSPGNNIISGQQEKSRQKITGVEKNLIIFEAQGLFFHCFHYLIPFDTFDTIIWYLLILLWHLILV